MSKKKRPVALVDLDGTLADFAGQMYRDMSAVSSPDEMGAFKDQIFSGDESRLPPFMVARRDLIKRQPDWWRNLPRLEAGFEVIDMMRKLEYRLHILSRGPKRNCGAWAQKVQWALEHVSDAQVTIGHDKSLVYGKVLFDDWPAYVEPWLDVRPRGLVIMLAQPWNEGFKHDRVIRYTGDNGFEVFARLKMQRATVEPVDAEWSDD